MPAPAAPAAPASAPAAQNAKPKCKPRRKLLFVLLGVVLLGGGAAAWWFLRAGAAADTAAAAPAAKPRDIALEPAFVVNLADADGARYLQADVQLLTHDPATVAAIELHGPLIRNRLLLLFGQHTSLQLRGRQGKERLQDAALAEVRALLKAQTSPARVDAVLFTSLVTQ